ncbi:MAG: beta-eliminating lyase-related protein [Alphaproteobacteria bacterium]
MDFRSDNVAGVAEEIMAAIAAANVGTAAAYGDDEITERLEPAYSELFETEVRVFPVLTGTIANALSASVLSPPYGAIFAAADAHIFQDECGAPELFTGGAKLIPLAGQNGKIPPKELRRRLQTSGQGFVHAAQPAAFSVTQTSEAGAVYSAGEIAELSAIAQGAGLGVHMDGARFANAVAALNAGNETVSPADLTWRAGVDVLSFGATKNGALGAEAIILFRTELAEEMAFRHKRAGQLASKMRYISAQLAAYIEDGLWLRLADHANRMCGALAKGLGVLDGVRLDAFGGANELFVELPGEAVIALREEGFQFYDWPETIAAEASRRSTIRLVTRHDNSESDVDGLVEAVKRLVG